MKNLSCNLKYFNTGLRPRIKMSITFIFQILVTIIGFTSLMPEARSATPVSPKDQAPPSELKTELKPYQGATVSSKDKTNPFIDSLVSAYMTNSELRSKVEQQKALDEQVAKTTSAFRPSVEVDASSGINRNERQTAPEEAADQTFRRFRNRRTTHPSNAGVTLNQSLFNGGADLANTDSAENSAIAGQYDYLSTEQKTLLDAVSAYMNLIFTEKALEINKKSEQFLSEQLAGMVVQVSAGEKTLTDQAQTEARLAEATANVYSAEADHQNAQAKYETIIGTKPGLLVQPPPVAGLPGSKEELIESAKNTNPRILQAIYSEKSAKNEMEVAQRKLLPRVDFQGNAGRNLQQSTSRDRSNQASAILKLSVPLYQGGGEWATIREKADNAARARYDLEQARKKAIEDAIAAWMAWESAKQKITSLLLQVKASEKSRDGALLEVEVGERSYLDVLDAQRELFRAQLNLLEALRGEVVAQYQILSVIGRLTARNLQLPVQEYDIKGHLEKVRNKIAGT